MHIPKTAGTSLFISLHASLNPVQVIHGFDRFLFGSFDAYLDLDEAIQRTIFASPSLMPPDADLVAGHFAWSTLRVAYPEGRFLTILREPTTRLLSHWLFWRQMPDDRLVGWATWTDRVREARRPLAKFLSEPGVACQTDNLATRALLWPHRLIPEVGFIDPKHDRQLLDEAAERLRRFDFVDVVENAQLEQRLRAWLERPFTLQRANETTGMPAHLRSPLAREITPEAHELLEMRSRIDIALWREVAGQSVQSLSPTRLRDRTLIDSVARLASVMTA